MSTRTEQDNDITLYSLPELLIMLRKVGSHSWVPFTLEEIKSQIKIRS